VRLERRLDEIGIRVSPAEPGENTDVAALDEAEATRAAGDLRELPREEVAPGLSVELVRLGEEERLAWQVDTVAENVRGDAHVRGARQEAVDLLAPRRERHRSVEDGDAPRMQPVDLSGQSEHGLAAERHENRALAERAERPLAHELERQLPFEDLQLGLWEGALDERERVERAQEEDLPELARQQEPRPRRAALLVVGPLDLVEDEQRAPLRRHLDRRREDRRVLVDALLPRDQADVLEPDLLAQPAVRLLGEHPQRPGVHARARLHELLERRVRLAGVRRAEMRDDALGLALARRERDLDAALGLLDGVRRPAPLVALRAARPLLTTARRTTLAHRPTVAACERAGSG
jgi:hypothetical protein